MHLVIAFRQNLDAGRTRSTLCSVQGELKLGEKGAGNGGRSAAGDSSTELPGDVPTEEDEFDLKDLMSEEIGVRRRACCTYQDVINMSTALHIRNGSF